MFFSPLKINRFVELDNLLTTRSVKEKENDTIDGLDIYEGSNGHLGLRDSLSTLVSLKYVEGF